MLETLWDPFTFDFMREAFLVAAIIAVPSALLSCLLVLKGWALMGDAISHAVLPGIVLAAFFNVPVLIGAFIAAMLCALAAGFLKENSRLKEDTALGVVFTGLFGLGLVLFVKLNTLQHLDHILFGNILGLDQRDMLLAAAICVLVCLVFFVLRRDFMLHSFDVIQAQAVGLPVRWLHYGLLAMLSITVVAILNVVGIILAIGLLIAPGAIAFLLTQRFERMLLIAVAINVFAGIFGVYLSFFFNSEPAPTIILVLTVLFLAVYSLEQINNRLLARKLP